MRRLLSLITAAAILTSLALLSSCTLKQQFSRTEISVFDTQTVILGWETSKSAFDENADAVMDMLTEYHRLYDIYYEYEGINNLKTVNENAGKSPVKVDDRIIELLLYSKEMHKLTDGNVNVAMGSVLSVWHEYRERGLREPEKAALPPMDVLEAAALHTDIEKVVIDEEASTVYLSDPEMSLDVGAVAKGYSVEMVAQYLEEQGCAGYALSVGGNVRCIGEKPNGEKWEVGVQNPDMTSSEAYVAKVYFTDETLVTSGVYQRYYTVAEKQYHHIIDPKTLMPGDEYASVSIITDHSGLADALSTALFNLSEKEGLAIAEKVDAEVAWVYADGRIEMTDGFKKLQE